MTNVQEACSVSMVPSVAPGPRDRQFLFSFYNHARPSFDGQPLTSPLHGRMVPRARRIEVRSSVPERLHTLSGQGPVCISARRVLPHTPTVIVA